MPITIGAAGSRNRHASQRIGNRTFTQQRRKKLKMQWQPAEILHGLDELVTPSVAERKAAEGALSEQLGGR